MQIQCIPPSDSSSAPMSSLFQVDWSGIREKAAVLQHKATAAIQETASIIQEKAAVLQHKATAAIQETASVIQETAAAVQHKFHKATAAIQETASVFQETAAVVQHKVKAEAGSFVNYSLSSPVHPPIPSYNFRFLGTVLASLFNHYT